MTTQVLLNCFPPTSLTMPSIGCEILKEYILNENSIESEVIYWNHLFNDTAIEEKSSLIDSHGDTVQILPFLSILYGNSEIIKNRVLFKMQESIPGLISLSKDYYHEKLEDQIRIIQNIIDFELNKILKGDHIVFGVSAKFDSWIPGVVVAREVKKRRPDAICVLGGIEEETAAISLFKEFKVFDFAIWGEGEIPLSLLINNLKNKNKDYSNIPRLIIRGEEYIPQKEVDKKSFLNFNKYLSINYETYFDYAKNIDVDKIQLPIEISRGCRWNKCNFCALSMGNMYRTQAFEEVVDQIKNNYLKYKITRYFFVDNDIVGKNIKLFTQFLDKLIELGSQLEVEFNFHADILHLNFNKTIIKKLSLAGFKSVQIGYEGVSDSMLKKLNKSTTFAENLLFVKYAQKYDVEVTITGLIIGIPGENENDVHESVDNLHYLRFFLGQKAKQLQHRFAELMLFYETGYWNMLSNEKRMEFNKHPLNEFLPNSFIEDTHVAYSVLGQWKRPELMDKWLSFKKISDYYEKSDFEYFIVENDGVINYLEYKDNVVTNSLNFNQPEYWEVLKLANDNIISIDKLEQIFQYKYPSINKHQLIEIVEELKESHLLYSSINYNKIVSIIDTDRM